MIKLEKAIEILKRNTITGIPAGEFDHLDAVRLGIEAMKVRVKRKNQLGLEFYRPLPGEEV